MAASALEQEVTSARRLPESLVEVLLRRDLLLFVKSHGRPSYVHCSVRRIFGRKSEEAIVWNIPRSDR